MADFIDGDNHHHRHTGIGLNTPADVHYGLAAAAAKDRFAVLATARAANPNRFSTTTDPKIPALPGTTWINKPLTNMTTKIKDQSTAVKLAAYTPTGLIHLGKLRGANVKAVQRMLGHASAAVTLDVYSDLFDSNLDAVSTALDQMTLNSNFAKTRPLAKNGLPI